MDERIRRTIKSLHRHNMAGFFVRDRQALLDLLACLIPRGQTVGCGDSATLEACGVFEFLRNGDFVFYDKHRPGLTRDEKHTLYLRNFSADTFLTGTNAVTTDGKLLNIDGNGSRVAPMLYGPRQVLVVVGRNKIVENAEEAVRRARQVAAPLDARRLRRQTPCTKLGRCVDCAHPQRICNDFVLITGQFLKNRIKVVVLDEDLGF